MQWKRKLSGFLAALMMMSVMPTTAFAWEAPAVSTWAQASREGVKARFFVGSDTHIGRNQAASDKLTNALAAFNQVDPQADGVLLVGDITNSGAESQYTTLKGIIDNSTLGQAGKVVLSMGNHEFNTSTGAVDRFTTGMAQEPNEVIYYNQEAGGVETSSEATEGLVATVVKMSANGYSGDYTGQYEMLKTALETSQEKNGNAPVIVMGHHGIQNTAYVTNEWYGKYGEGTEKDMVALMKQYPQTIHISGHSHSTLEDARSIYQDGGFTAIQDSTIGAYFENETGKVDPSSGNSSTYPEGAEDSSQALRIDVMENGQVKIYRMDLTEGTYMYENEPWTFSKDDLPYTADRRENSQAPNFAQDAKVTASSTSGTTMTVQFPAATEASASNEDMIHEYWITLKNTDTDETTVRKVFADYYKAPADRKTEWPVKIKDLEANTTYSVEVKAVTSFNVKSKAITTEEDITTGEGYKPVYPAQAILDVDFSQNATGADAKGHTKKIYGQPQFVKDETLGRTVASFDGEDDGLRYAMTSDDYEKLTQNFTIELYYKPKDTENKNPMGNTETSGFCFEQKRGTNTLQFWTHIGGSYIKPEMAVAKDQWNHVVGTYDGQNVKMYLNGQLKSTKAATGSLKEPPHYLFLGGDTSESGELEYQANCEIALARVYTGTMTAADVQAAYEAAAGVPETEPAADILNVDFSTGAETDRSANALVATKRGSGSITYVQDEDLSKKVANFDGNSAYSYAWSSQYDKLKNGMTFEVTYNYNTVGSEGEYDLLSNQQGGGFGLGSDGGRLKFFCHVGGDYVTPNIATPAAGQWHHAVGVYNGDSVKLYVDGQEVSSKVASGSIGFPTNSANELFIGADSGPSNALQFPADVKIATARIYSQALTASQIAKLAEDQLPAEDTTPVADMLDVDFSDGTAKDHSVTANETKPFGSPVIADNQEIGKKVASFNGSYDAYLYPFDDTKYSKMTTGATIESVFCYDEIPASGEYDMFSNQQGGGLGLGLENGRLQFYCNINKTAGGNGYVQPNAAIEAGKWYHAVGVFDGSKVKLFLNGQLVSEKDAGGSTIHWTTSSGAKNFVIGGDSNSENEPESYSKGSVSMARLYSQAMTDAQVQQLYAELDPVMIDVDGSTGSIPLNQSFSVPAGTASNGSAVTVAVTDPNGQAVTLTDGKFTPTVEGKYTFTYTVEGSTAKRIFVRAAMDLENLPINLGLVATKQAAAGSKFNVAVHLNRDSGLTVGTQNTFELTYDPALVSYVGAENTKSGLTITDDKNGKLTMGYTGTVSDQAFKNYSATRLVKLTFQAKEAQNDANAAFAFQNVSMEAETGKVNAVGTAIKLVGRSSLDKNGDGVIGAGDVALASSAEEAKAIAAAAAIYPYKHVVTITMDGGGICFRPDQMYYAANGNTALTDDAGILAKRTNDYAMQLFNEYCAASYSTKSETPTISAQNYTSIIHGKEYADAQPEYQITNNESGTDYYPDFGKETPVYPSIFKALGQAFPQRGNAAFAEWTPIVNGIIEPDAPVYTHGSTKNTGDMQNVADYIRSDDFKNTAMIYMQSDYMDAVGHGHGYYTDYYYTELKKYDGYFQNLMKALEETGTKDETMVLFTSDHGGTIGGSHGGTTDQEYDVQIALGGQTIDSGKTLTGGTNHDPSVIALTALRASVPASMDGSADLFQQASLNQEELVKKDRAVETVTATAGTNVNAVELKLSDVQSGHTVTAADLVVDLNGQRVKSIQTSGTVIRQEEKDGKLYLTISYSGTTETLARINLNGRADGVKVTEYMLGTAEGKEVYGDLVNTTGKLTVTGSSSDGSSSGSSSSAKPVVTAGEGGSAVLSGDGKTVNITPDAGYEIADVVVNGKSQGAVSSVTVKKGDKVQVTFQKIQTGDTQNPFVDLKGHWAEKDVLKTVDQGLFQGTSSTTFSPDETLTRGMMVTVLYRLAGEPAMGQASPFTDVADSAYYADAVAWAAEEGIVLGVSETLFCPNQPITRQQLAAVLYRYCGSPAADGSLTAYPDSGSVAAYAKDAMSWAVGSGIIQGSDGKLLPTGQATRAQAAVMLLRLTDLLDG